MHRVVVNVETGEVTQVDLTEEEIAEAQAQKAAWDAEQAAIDSAETIEEIKSVLP